MIITTARIIPDAHIRRHPAVIAGLILRRVGIDPDQIEHVGPRVALPETICTVCQGDVPTGHIVTQATTATMVTRICVTCWWAHIHGVQ